MRIATWNVNNVVARTERLLAWLESAQPDVLCLQELKVPADQMPVAEIEAAGYAVAARGDARWNGVAILSRVGLDDVTYDLTEQPAWDGVVEPRAIAATCGGVRVWSLYVPNGRTVADPHYSYKLEWLASLRDTAAAELARPEPLAILGDFNVAPTDADVWDISQFAGATHVSAPGAGRAHGARGRRPRRGGPAGAEVRRAVHVLGLPPARLPEEHRHAHRPGLRVALARLRRDRRLRRPRRAQARQEGHLAPSDHAPLVVDVEL